MTDDPSRPESGPSSSPPEAVSLDKPVVNAEVNSRQALGTNQTQEGGSSPWADAQAASPGAGNAARNVFQSGASGSEPEGGPAAMPGAAVQSDVGQKKLVAGLLGVFLGGLGVHKFYLGNTTPALIMLICTLGGWILGIIGSLVIVGAVFFIIPWVVGVIGLIEGVIYLTKSDTDFQREYLAGKKPWF